MQFVKDALKSGVVMLLLIGLVFHPLTKAVAETFARFDGWISGIPFLHPVLANTYLHWPALLAALAIVTFVLGALWHGFGLAVILWWLRGCREVKIYEIPGDDRRGKRYLVLGTYIAKTGKVFFRCFLFLHFWPPNGISEEVTADSEGVVWEYTGCTAWDHVRRTLKYGVGVEREEQPAP